MGCHPDTIIEHVGCDPARNVGIGHPPVYHTSTVIFPSLKTLLETCVDRASGGLHATPKRPSPAPAPTRAGDPPPPLPDRRHPSPRPPAPRGLPAHPPL